MRKLIEAYVFADNDNKLKAIGKVLELYPMKG